MFLSRNGIFGLPTHCRAALFSTKPATLSSLSSAPCQRTLSSQCHPCFSRPKYHVSNGSPLSARYTATSTSHPATSPKIEDKDPLPPYKPPTTGFISYLPASMVPYAELARLDKPTGTVYLFLPCLFSTLLAAPLAPIIPPPTTILTTTLLFATGALIMRSAGCTINDLWDRNLDPHVRRTAHRPLARRAITPFAATTFLGIQLFSGLGILLQFPHTYQCCLYAIPSLIPVFLYPLAKRITNYPQVVLGLTFSWGAIMGFPALGTDLLQNSQAATAAACLYASNIAWTVLYDMIYAHMDIKDDAKVGIKSIALAHATNTKMVLSGLAVAQISLLTAAGMVVDAGPAFFVGLGGAVGTLGVMIWRVRLESVRNCWWWFVNGAYFTGGALVLGLGGEYVIRYLERDSDSDEVVVAQT